MADVSQIEIASGVYDIKDLSARNTLNQLNSLKYQGDIVAFGDSITVGYPINYSWANEIANLMGATLFNFAINGSSFSNNSIATQVDTANEQLTINKNDVSYVLLSGGINDHSSSYNTINEGVKQTITKIRNVFPNAKIIAVPCLCASKPLNFINQGDNQYLHVTGTFSVIKALYNNIINNMVIMNNAPLLLQGLDDLAFDDVHPNKNGSILIGRSVYNWLCGGDSSSLIKQTSITLSHPNIKTYECVKISNGYCQTIYGSLTTSADNGIQQDSKISDRQNNLLFSYGSVLVVNAFYSTKTISLLLIDGTLYSRENIPANTTVYFNLTLPIGV